MNYQTACQILQVGPKPQMTVGHVLINFKSMIVTDNRPEQVSMQEFIKAKNILLRKLLDEQLRINNRYDLGNVFEEPCPVCKGAGEIYEFLYRKIKIPCKNKECNNGVIGTCKTCGGTGTFVRTDKEDPGLRFKLKCIKCRDGKEICPVCRGKGGRTRFVIAKIRRGETCRRCRGVGFKLPEYLKLFNAVGAKIADAELELKKKITTVAEAVQTSPPEPVVFVSTYQGKLPVRTFVTEIDEETEKLMRDSI